MWRWGSSHLDFPEGYPGTFPKLCLSVIWIELAVPFPNGVDSFVKPRNKPRQPLVLLVCLNPPPTAIFIITINISRINLQLSVLAKHSKSVTMKNCVTKNSDVFECSCGLSFAIGAMTNEVWER